MAFDRPIATATICMEAGGESDDGKLGVAYSFVNRLKAGHFGTTLTEVCLEPYQYSSWNTSAPTRKTLARLPNDDVTLQHCGEILDIAMAGSLPDPTFGAIYYWRDDIPTPPWAAPLIAVGSLVQTAHIGHHLFFKPKT